MSWFSWSPRSRDYGEENRLAREADLPRRLAVLTPEAAANWIEIIDKALPLVARETPKRPCDYGPWRRALGTLPAPDQPEETYTLRFADADSGLINFATDASKQGWPDDHAHLVEFALRYLEADVMFFRSGYTKRHLLRRLRQASLDQSQKDRAIGLIKRAVTHGTGVEEFREFKRLAGRVADNALKAWLIETADGAFLNVRGKDYWDVFGLPDAGKKAREGAKISADLKKPEVSPLNVASKDLPDDNRTKRNAWHILCHLRLNERQTTHGLPLD